MTDAPFRRCYWEYQRRQVVYRRRTIDLQCNGVWRRQARANTEIPATGWLNESLKQKVEQIVLAADYIDELGGAPGGRCQGRDCSGLIGGPGEGNDPAERARWKVMKRLKRQFGAHRVADEMDRTLRIQVMHVTNDLCQDLACLNCATLRRPEWAACVPAKSDGQTFVFESAAKAKMLRPTGAVPGLCLGMQRQDMTVRAGIGIIWSVLVPVGHDNDRSVGLPGLLQSPDQGAGTSVQLSTAIDSIDPDYWHMLCLIQDVVVPLCHNAMTLP